MPYILGEDRNQLNLLPNTLEDFVDEDNPVRVIDAYVDSLNLEELGFAVFSGSKAGQKPYRRQDLLKLYIYCYMNKIRSSRMMEIEATRNIELMWLIGKIKPDHGTISSFMKINKNAIKQLFKEFTLMLKGFGLIDGTLVAIDGTKLKASCAKNKHYNENIIKEKLEYYETKIEEYINGVLNTTDDENMKQKINDKIECYQERIKKLNDIKEELKEQGKKQICLTDSDAKSMKNNGKFEVCFNFQGVVDNKNKLIVDFDVVNDVNDQGQLSNMVKKAKEVFEDQNITALADTGYFNMSEIVDVVDEQTEILIKPQKGKQQKVENGFDKSNFKYDHINDVFVCPMGYCLNFKWNGKQNGKDFKRYTCVNYNECGKKEVCTSAKGGRSIIRFKDEDIIDQVTENTIKKDNIYKKRGSIIEHFFGTIKRHFGYTYFLTRGLESVNTEVSFICLAYNFKRMIKIIGVKELIRKFRGDLPPFLYDFCDFNYYCYKYS
ncbi:IS1182 family transposase [Bacillus canaveralius]|uniref:IS1182 family transposase n=1 Tax=Bacillus canaveralius TaxID=1403243 RepID=UPI001C60FA26|nr:IS1182 family transposase [Bacillus canaveralius]